MAHFAKLDDNNVVLSVYVVNNDIITDENGDEQESLGISFLQGLYGDDTNWVQTSYNANVRGEFAAKGGTYNAEKDKFIVPAEYPSWTLDENDVWQPPVDYPADFNTVNGLKGYVWNEDTTSWDVSWEATEPYPDDGKTYSWIDGAWVDTTDQ
tara:strand:+ start:116 stop:574 length:459 start_codon:yes stop_codon:yes gene_type:complete